MKTTYLFVFILFCHIWYYLIANCLMACNCLIVARIGPFDLVLMSSLSWLKLSDLDVYVQDLYGANFSNS